ncbi:GspH/FimT family protein [Ramlibacter sp. PS4R-6]|uniref:GspH/FimT family protein n=1 Tax=Ramlibacter sp. PS4R-6 TaxID=3133438 RepID=UPI0030B22023
MKKLLAAVALACAFQATPVPAHLNAMLESVQVSAASFGFAADLKLARTEAIRRASRVVLCKSADGERCTAAGPWSQGWIAFDDADGNGVRGRGEKIFVRERPFAATLRTVGSFNLVHAVAFGPTGAATLVGAATPTSALTICRQTFERTEGTRVTLEAGKSPQLRSERHAACA